MLILESWGMVIIELLEIKLRIASTSFWNIAQWSNPTPFTTNSVSYTQGSCSTPNAYWNKAGTNARICAAPVGNRNNYIELASNGLTNLQCGVEFNMFVQTNKKPATPNTNINMTGGLSSYSSINFGFAAQIKYSSVAARCGTFPQVSCTRAIVNILSAVHLLIMDT